MSLQHPNPGSPVPPETPPTVAPPTLHGFAMPPASEAVSNPAAAHRAAPGKLDVLQNRTLPAPTAIACLRCQLIGKRQLTCSRAHACAELPQSFALGPILLAAWAATAVAFVIAVL